MPTPPPPTPAERFAAIVAWLTQAVITQGAWGLSQPLIVLIITRLRGIKQRVAQIVACIDAGSYAPRRFTPRRPPALRKPRPPDPLPRTFGWLRALVPSATGYRSQLENLLLDAAMVELIQAAPASLGRPLRSLCWMLGLKPPPVLAPPARPRPPRKTPPVPPEPPPPPPAPQPPDWLRDRRKPWSMARIRGSPHRA